jgi:hypothetical protein
MSPQRVQLSRRKGYRKPEGAVVVARPSKWGNPYTVGSTVRTTDQHGRIQTLSNLSPYQAITLYRLWVSNWSYGDRPLDRPGPADFHKLKGRDLACWCPLDQPCHADVLLELANPSSA